MRRYDDRTEKSVAESLRSSLIFLAFGLSVLAFLVAIDRPEWFHIRPASGTAAALSHATSGGIETRRM